MVDSSKSRRADCSGVTLEVLWLGAKLKSNGLGVEGTDVSLCIAGLMGLLGDEREARLDLLRLREEGDSSSEPSLRIAA